MLFSLFITFAIVLLSLAQSYSECEFKFGNRTFLPSKAPRLPPVLYTFPGSGNTWVRLLIEFSTGILSGSAPIDQSLVLSRGASRGRKLLLVCLCYQGTPSETSPFRTSIFGYKCFKPTFVPLYPTKCNEVRAGHSFDTQSI